MHSSPSVRIRVKNNAKHPRVVTQVSQSNRRPRLVDANRSNCKKIYDLQQRLLQIQKRYQSQMSDQSGEEEADQLQICDTISESQFSSVFRVRHKPESKIYALKTIKEQQNMMLNEGKICQLVKNNFIADIVQVKKKKKGETQQTHILMKFYQFNFEDVLRGSATIDQLNIKILVYQMARAVHYLHMKGICHRDARPSNFFVDLRGRLYLGDFGSAKKLREGNKRVCYLGGRPYRAPQLHLGLDDYSQSVDIWALGCIIIQLATAKQLFKGSGGIDCLLNIGRYLGTKQMKRMAGNSELVKLMPNIVGKGLEDIFTSQEKVLGDLVTKMLRVDSKLRIKTIDILSHEYFDDLRDEQIYRQILQKRCDISNFFDFTALELKNYQQYYSKLIPFWKKQQKSRPLLRRI